MTGRKERVGVTTDRSDAAAGVRLDKWLWAARFFKTRSLASQSIDAGHVKIDGNRPKAAYHVRIGDEISITIAPYTRLVKVLQVSSVRRGAPEARLLYEETAGSIAAREAVAAMLKADRAAYGPPVARPSKRDRRAIDRLRGR
jgi:ribosome-associated heat shock protein Hsp15